MKKVLTLTVVAAVAVIAATSVCLFSPCGGGSCEQVVLNDNKEKKEKPLTRLQNGLIKKVIYPFVEKSSKVIMSIQLLRSKDLKMKS